MILPVWRGLLVYAVPRCRGRAAAKAYLMPNDVEQHPRSRRSLPSNELRLQKKETHPEWSECPEEREDERKKRRGPGHCRGTLRKPQPPRAAGSAGTAASLPTTAALPSSE